MRHKHASVMCSCIITPHKRTCDIMLDDLQLFEYIMDLTVLDSCTVM